MVRFEVPEEEKSKRYYVEASVSGFLDGMSEEAVREEIKKILNIFFLLDPARILQSFFSVSSRVHYYVVQNSSPPP